MISRKNMIFVVTLSNAPKFKNIFQELDTPDGLSKLPHMLLQTLPGAFPL